MKGWAERDFHAATAHVLSAPESDPARSKDVAYEMLWTVWHAGGEESTAEWLRVLRDDARADKAFKTGAWNTTMEAYSRGGNFEAATALLRANTDAAACLSPNAISSLMALSKTPDDRMNFIDALGPDPATGQFRQIEATVSGWVTSDPNGPGLWLKSHTDAPVYDQTAAAYAASLVTIDPSAAEQWGKTIRDPKLRGQTLQQLNGKGR
jgi:hypothetical protein